MVECITCGADVALHEDVEAGEIVDCGTCGTELEILEADPVAVGEAPELEQDWGE